MVIDPSAIVAILLREPGWEQLLQAIEQDAIKLIAMPSVLELHMIAQSRLGAEGVCEMEFFLLKVGIQKIAMDEDQLLWATYAFNKFGKGRHPAALNFGDCFSYALAKTSGEPLLFKGADFSKTDLPKPTTSSAPTATLPESSKIHSR